MSSAQRPSLDRRVIAGPCRCPGSRCGRRGRSRPPARRRPPGARRRRRPGRSALRLPRGC
ncbi:hypothetical protein E7Z54_22290 [Nocardioides sp.]|nr:hypothetical protein E7Z54_22290 [Nocardioides sp.]